MSAGSKARGDIAENLKWKLSDLIKDEGEFNAEYQEALRLAEEVAAMEGKVKENPKAAIEKQFACALLTEKLYVYARMTRDTDGADGKAQALAARAETLMAKVGMLCAYLEPELLTLNDETLQKLKEDKDFCDYSAYVGALRRRRPHTLPAGEEKLLANLREALGGPQDIFNMLSNIDLPRPNVVSDKGESVKLTPATYEVLIKSRDREVRKNAFCGVMNAYGAFSSTIAAAYSASVKGMLGESMARGFKSCAEASLFPDEIPLSVYTSLITAVESAVPALNRYLNLRKKALKLDELHMYDLYTPIVSDYDMDMSYDEAKTLIKKALLPLGDEYQALLERAFSERWIDVYETEGKQAGAYSWGAYGTHPYVLLNHTDNLGGASTLAHELGHAMHSFFSDRAQPFPKAQYSLFVAEVASTVNEMLLMRYLLSELKEDKAQAYLLNQLLEEFRTTVFRQTLFAAFELESHAMAERGEPLTGDTLTEAYMKCNEKIYGGACVIDPEIGREWMRIPHFYTDFYVYKYATGFSAAVAISGRILREGESAVRDYLRFLSLGGSVPPLTALKVAGVDMSTPAPVAEALETFADTVKKLEALL